jgi:PAS domain S-box-containing protein
MMSGHCKEVGMIDRMNEEVLRAMLEAMPVELSVIDTSDEVIGWNKHETRLFHRPMSSMGLNFRDCHPQESLAKVEQIVAEMRAGTRQKARFWIDHAVTPGGPKHKILIEFYALTNSKGEYLGCMECAQDVQEIMELEGQKRLLD